MPRAALDAAHLDDLQGEGEVQSQMRVVSKRPEDPLELADAIAQRVVVEVEYARCLRDVEVCVEQDLERPAQVAGLAVVSLPERSERLADEGPQLRRIRHKRS